MRFLYILTTVVAFATAISNTELREKYMTDGRIYLAYEYCSELHGNSDFFTMEKCMMNKLIEFAWEIDNVEISFPKGLESEAENYCSRKKETNSPRREGDDSKTKIDI
nr:hypothetical transcript [Hymenolepis microstoma]